jgi:hypothetical protein
MSKMEALEAENACLKDERSGMKELLTRKRYQLREEKKLHDKPLSAEAPASVAATQLAAAEDVQLSQTIKTTNHSLEEAQKSLKKLGDQVSSRPTVP